MKQTRDSMFMKGKLQRLVVQIRVVVSCHSDGSVVSPVRTVASEGFSWFWKVGCCHPGVSCLGGPVRGCWVVSSWSRGVLVVFPCRMGMLQVFSVDQWLRGMPSAAKQLCKLAPNRVLAARRN